MSARPIETLCGAADVQPAADARKPWTTPAMIMPCIADETAKNYYNREVVNSFNTIGPS